MLPPTALIAVRLVSVAAGVGTCVVLYLLGKRLFDERAGRFAAGFYAVAPLAVQHAHFATVDVPATFAIALALLFAVRALSEGGRHFLWAGLWSGLAAATKYNAGLVLLAGIAAWYLSAPRTPRALAILVGSAVLGFLVGCPGALLNASQFARDLSFEIAHARSGSDNLFTGTPLAAVYHLSFTLPWALNWALFALALFGLVQAARRRNRGDVVLAAFALPYFLLIGFAQIKFARYTLPLFPPLLLWAGASLPAGRRRPHWEKAYFGAGLIAFVYSAGFNNAMTGADPRDTAASWLRDRNVGMVGFARGPWYWSPPLAPGLSHPNPARAKQAAVEFAGNPPIPIAATDGDWNLALLQNSPLDAIALSELEYTDALRLNEPAARTYLDAVRKDWPNQQVFSQPIRAFGLSLARIDTTHGLPQRRLPHDMLYTNPTIVVFFK